MLSRLQELIHSFDRDDGAFAIHPCLALVACSIFRPRKSPDIRMLFLARKLPLGRGCGTPCDIKSDTAPPLAALSGTQPTLSQMPSASQLPEARKRAGQHAGARCPTLFESTALHYVQSLIAVGGFFSSSTKAGYLAIFLKSGSSSIRFWLLNPSSSARRR